VLGYVRFRVGQVEELPGLDSMLRDHDADSLRRMRDRIFAFQARLLEYTDEGNSLKPFWHFKLNRENGWTEGSGTITLKRRNRQRYRGILPYIYTWVTSILDGEQGVFGPNSRVCLATLAAAVGVGVSGIHSQTVGTQICVPRYEWSEPNFGAYTLSGICYPLTSLHPKTWYNLTLAGILPMTLTLF
jgi:hypothetical protein